MLAIDQDALGKQAVRMATSGAVDIYVKDLEDGGKAVGFFNRDSSAQTINFNKLGSIGLNGGHHVRDLWRQQDLPDVTDAIQVMIPAHGVELYKFTPAN